MVKFLQNNFEDPRWQSAAVKNAYALLGKQRFRKYHLQYSSQLSLDIACSCRVRGGVLPLRRVSERRNSYMHQAPTRLRPRYLHR